DHAVFDDAADLVDVGAVAAEADGGGSGLATVGVVLGQHQIADHAAGFAHIDLVRPTAVVGELVLGQAETLHVGAHFLRHARVGGEEMEQAAVVVLVLFGDLLALGVAGLGPRVRSAGQIAAEG